MQTRQLPYLLHLTAKMQIFFQDLDFQLLYVNVTCENGH